MPLVSIRLTKLSLLRETGELNNLVKRTQKAAPLNHAVAPDIAKSRSQVNRVVIPAKTSV